MKNHKEFNKLLTAITLSDLLTGINYEVISYVWPYKPYTWLEALDLKPSQ